MSFRTAETVFRRITYIAVYPILMMGVALTVVLVPFIWVFTGKNVDEIEEYMENVWEKFANWAGAEGP